MDQLKRKCSYLIGLITVAIVAAIPAGCGKKEEAPTKAEQQKPAVAPDMIEYTLSDGTKVEVDANKFGVKYLPNGDIFSYEYSEDVRNLVDSMGQPIEQPVYKHELLMETKENIDNLIKFFFPKTPHIANRRKRGNEDMYVRLVSTRDMDAIRELDEPYIVIDMRVVYPRAPQRAADERSRVTATVDNTAMLMSLDDQIAALRSNLDRLRRRLEQDDVQIPERRTLNVQISMLERQLDSLTEKREDIAATEPQKTENEQVSAPVVAQGDKKVKIKIVSFNKREGQPNQ